MAPKSKAQTALARAGASDSEDDLAGMEHARPTAVAKAPKGKGRKKDAMPVRQEGASTTATTKRKAPAKSQSRAALKDRTNVPSESDAEETERVEEDDTALKPKRAKTTKPARKPAPKPAPRADVAAIAETQPDAEENQSLSQHRDCVKLKNTKRQNNDSGILIDRSIGDVSTMPTLGPAQRFVQRPRATSVQPLQPRASGRAPSVQPLIPRPSARAVSAQPGYPRPRDRSGSMSDTARERRGADPELRRKLNDMTHKYENLSLKYQSLQEIGQDNAESNFERLKRASDQKARDAQELITSLKKEIAELKKQPSATAANKDFAPEIADLKKQTSALTNANSSLETERDGLKSCLQISQNEVKSLEVKLVAARHQLSNGAPTSGNNAKTPKDLHRSVGPNATETQKEAKMKENLYSDLTGLIIRGVKRKEGEDEYDCIQTGRNGTLHFHLSIVNDATIANPKTPSGLSYEEAEFAYEPLLDESRDRELIDLLPDYLTEEICFPRNHAVKFYTRVVDSMTKKIVIED